MKKKKDPQLIDVIHNRVTGKDHDEGWYIKQIESLMYKVYWTRYSGVLPANRAQRKRFAPKTDIDCFVDNSDNNEHDE